MRWKRGMEEVLDVTFWVGMLSATLLGGVVYGFVIGMPQQAWRQFRASLRVIGRGLDWQPDGQPVPAKTGVNWRGYLTRKAREWLSQ